MKTIAKEQFDTVKEMSRMELVVALGAFLDIKDFKDETSDMCLPLDNNITLLGYDEGHYASWLMFHVRMGSVHTNTFTYHTITAGSLSTEDLRTVVDYLNLRLDAKGS